MHISHSFTLPLLPPLCLPVLSHSPASVLLLPFPLCSPAGRSPLRPKSPTDLLLFPTFEGQNPLAKPTGSWHLQSLPSSSSLLPLSPHFPLSPHLFPLSLTSLGTVIRRWRERRALFASVPFQRRRPRYIEICTSGRCGLLLCRPLGGIVGGFRLTPFLCSFCRAVEGRGRGDVCLLAFVLFCFLVDFFIPLSFFLHFL